LFLGSLWFGVEGYIQLVTFDRRESRSDEFFVVETETSAIPHLMGRLQQGEMRKLI